MLKKLPITILAILTLVLSDKATAEHWASCDGCGASTKNFAMSIPPDQPGQSVVNVYDNETQALSAFNVMIYYDYEFRAWMRFARQTQPSADAIAFVRKTKEARDFLEDLSDLIDPITIDVPSAQVFLLGRGAYDGLISNQLFRSMSTVGMWDRFVNASVAVGAGAARVIGKTKLSPKFLVVFKDGSSILVTTYFLANNDSATQITYVPGSAKLADGTRLPETPDDIDGLVIGTNSAATANALVAWIQIISPSIVIRRQSGQRGGVKYLFQCDENECTLTAISEEK